MLYLFVCLMFDVFLCMYICLNSTAFLYYLYHRISWLFLFIEWFSFILRIYLGVECCDHVTYIVNNFFFSYDGKIKSLNAKLNAFWHVEATRLNLLIGDNFRFWICKAERQYVQECYAHFRYGVSLFELLQRVFYNFTLFHLSFCFCGNYLFWVGNLCYLEKTISLVGFFIDLI